MAQQKDQKASFLQLNGSPTILLADDEELMREVTTLMIEDSGGEVISAVNGSEAVDIFRDRKGEIDGVLLDFSMPRLNGLEAYRKIRELSETVGCVIVSGLGETKEVQELVRKGEIAFLAKPFLEKEVIESLNSVLGDSSE